MNDVKARVSSDQSVDRNGRRGIVLKRELWKKLYSYILINLRRITGYVRIPDFYLSAIQLAMQFKKEN